MSSSTVPKPALIDSLTDENADASDAHHQPTSNHTNNTRFLVFGGTSPTGICVIRQLLNVYPRSTIVIYARNPSKLPADLNTAIHPSLVIIKGELTDRESVEKALEGVDVVLSALGPVFGEPNTTPVAKGYELIVDAMHKCGAKRLIALGTTSIKDPADKFSITYSGIIAVVKTGARSMYRDFAAIGEVIRNKGGDLDWTIARVPILTKKESNEFVAGHVGDGKVGTTLPRQAFAAFVVEEVEKRQWVKQAPLITSP